jgi:cephalosporin hydroxylase
MKNAHEFRNWRQKRANSMHEDAVYNVKSLEWLNEAVKQEYSYLFEWFGVPTIQFPSDLLLLQEAIFTAKPTKVIEVGIARGGTTLFLASIMSLLDKSSNISVIGVDISISKHTSEAIYESQFSSNIKLLEGDSTDILTTSKVAELLKPEDRVLAILDSNHSSEHVLKEIEIYSQLVTVDSFLIVMDTAIEYISADNIPLARPWSRGNSPQTAIDIFFEKNPDVLIIDENLNSKSFPGASRGGFLRKISPRI